MKKNQLTTTEATALVLGKSKSLMGITKKLLESKGKGLTQAKPSQELATHEGITIIGGLMWAKYADEKMNWDDAMAYAKNLRLGDYDDWRLPIIEELGEVVTLCGGELTALGDDNGKKKMTRNMENTQYQEAYKEKGFAQHVYWSATANSSSFAWYVNFSNGFQNWGLKINRYVLDDNFYYVRCVRAGE